MKIRDCTPEEFDSRPIAKIISFGTDGSVEYTITYQDGKLSVDSEEYKEMLAHHQVLYKGKVYSIKNPQEWMHGLLFEGNSYAPLEFEFAD
jgi:hypothetical protein